jgi:hypothetical protein
MVGSPTRQQSALAAIAGQLAVMPEILGALLAGSPGSGARLAMPWRVVTDDPHIASLYTARPPVDRTEFNVDAAHSVDRAFGELKRALRSLAGDGS